MRPFAYERATDVADALDRAGDGAVFLAGGTNLVDHLRLGVRSAERLVDITRIGLDEIEELPGGGLRVGALVRNSDLAAHPALRRGFPFVAQALLAGASGQLRNMATTGGNLLQRTRCVYFQDVTMPCTKRDPGSGCSALEGYGAGNAIFETSPRCMAVHPSDLCVALVALDAVVRTTGPAGDREIPMTELYRRAEDGPETDTHLVPGELVTHVDLPPLAPGTRSAYRKVRERASYAFALVSVAAALDVVDGRVRDARLGFGGVCHRPFRARRAEEALVGGPAEADAFGAAIDAELAHARPGRDNGAKVPILRNTALAVLAGLADEGARS